MPGVSEPHDKFDDVVEPIAIALEQERKVTDQISELTSIAREERDFVSEQFMQWFLKEQVEEIDLMSTLLHTAERSRDRPLDIEDFIAREGIGGDEGGRRIGAPGRRWLTSSCSRSPPGPDGGRDGQAGGGLPVRGAALARPGPLRRAPARPGRRPGGRRAGAAAGRGVAVRIAYNADHDERDRSRRRRSTKPELIEALPFPTRGIPGIPDLMHHKYVVRDGEAVWTGSTNWTTDSWTLQENLVAIVDARPSWPPPSRANFEELWRTRDVSRTGRDEPRASRSAGRVRAWFTPGPRRGPLAPDRGSDRPGRRRVRIASPVITAGPVIGTLAEVAAEGRVDLAAWSTAPQMSEVFGQWREQRRSAWKMPIAGVACSSAPIRAASPPPLQRPTRLHDFMHAKVTVADDIGLRRLVQPLALGRDERRERDRAPRPGAGRAPGRVHRRDPRALRRDAYPGAPGGARRLHRAQHVARSSVTVSRSRSSGEILPSASDPLADPVHEPPSSRSPPASPGSRDLPGLDQGQRLEHLVERAEAAGEDHERRSRSGRTSPCA